MTIDHDQRSGAGEPEGALSTTLVTLSYRGDFELCQLLCETVDRFVPQDIPHILIIPKSDFALFAPLASARRTLVAEDRYLPRWLIKLPLPSQAWRKRLFLPRRNIYLSLRGRPVRGWIAQQLMKLAAAASITTDTVLMIDSDVAFVRPFSRAAMLRDGKARLQRFRGAGDNIPVQVGWRAAANAILGLDRLPAGQDCGYIDNMVTWTPQNVRRLSEHIRATNQRDWMQMLAETPDFSEYILYGIFCERCLGLEAAGHFGADTNLCFTIWSDDGSGIPTDVAGIAKLVNATISPEHVAVGIQSTVPLSIEVRRALVDSIRP